MTIIHSSLYNQNTVNTTASGAVTQSSTYEYAGPDCERKGMPVVFRGTATVSTALALPDRIYLFPVVKGFRMTRCFLQWGDCDTSGSPTLDMDLGLITESPSVYFNAGTAFQSADATAGDQSQEALIDAPASTNATDVVGFTVIAAAAALSAAATITFEIEGVVA